MYLPPCGKRTCILQVHGEFPAVVLQNVLTQLKQHLQKFCRVRLRKWSTVSTVTEKYILH